MSCAPHSSSLLCSVGSPWSDSPLGSLSRVVLGLPQGVPDSSPGKRVGVGRL